MRQYTYFNDLANKSALGKDGVDRQVRSVLNDLVAQHGQENQIRHQQTQPRRSHQSNSQSTVSLAYRNFPELGLAKTWEPLFRFTRRTPGGGASFNSANTKPEFDNFLQWKTDGQSHLYRPSTSRPKKREISPPNDFKKSEVRIGLPGSSPGLLNRSHHTLIS